MVCEDDARVKNRQGRGVLDRNMMGQEREKTDDI
jgi:hypothetical protein